MTQHFADPDISAKTPSRAKTCVLMFSGGRDSTLAAVRLFRQGYRLVLVTVSSDHLVGIATVKRRLGELLAKLEIRATWLHVVQPPHFGSVTSPRHQTCLPCHAAYSAIGLRLALDHDAINVAFGYTGYQSDWLEQTPQAIQTLRYELKTRGIELLLPVVDLSSKAEAIGELQLNGLRDDALEQKCLIQQFNPPLRPGEMTAELQRWGRTLEQTFEVAQREGPEIVECLHLDPSGVAP